MALAGGGGNPYHWGVWNRDATRPSSHCLCANHAASAPASAGASPSPARPPAATAHAAAPRRVGAPAALDDHPGDLGRARRHGAAAMVCPRPAAAGSSARRVPPPQPDAGGPRRPDLRHVRRRGRRSAAADRHAALPTGRRGRGRGSPLLARTRHRPGRPRPCRADQPAGGTSGPGRLHHHPAGGKEPVPDQRAHPQAQGAGVDADLLAGEPFYQKRDPRDLAEPRLPGRRRMGDGRGGAHLLRRLRPARQPVAGGGACRPAAGALALQPAQQSRSRGGTRASGIGRNGGRQRDH